MQHQDQQTISTNLVPRLGSASPLGEAQTHQVSRIPCSGCVLDYISLNWRTQLSLLCNSNHIISDPRPSMMSHTDQKMWGRASCSPSVTDLISKLPLKPNTDYLGNL